MKIRESFSARRLVCLTGIAFAGMGAGDAMASSSVSVGTSGFDGSSRVSFSAASAETNNVSFSRLSSSAVRVNDFTTPLDPIAPCVAVDANNVDCPIESDKPWIVNAYLLDMNDTLAFNPPADGKLQAGEGATDRSFVNGGPGNDTFEGTSGPDTLDGEAGNDSLSGLGGTDDLIGGADNDTIQAYDSRVDSVINCGDGLDALNRDNVDPAGLACESTQTFAADMNRNFEQRMPNVLSGIFKPMAAEEIVDTLSLLFPARLDARPLSYAQAKALAGGEPEPFEVIEQQPAAGVGVLASLGSPQKVRLSYWDPSDDAVRQKCEPKTRVRARGQKSKGLRLSEALVGLEFREGVKGNEGEAQELMRRFGCQFETKLVYSRSLETGSRVLDAKFKGYYSKVEVNGRIKKVKKFKLIVQAKVAKSGNDYILLFSDNPDAPGNQLPLSSKSRAAKRENSSFRLFLRETATGRAAAGAKVELHDGDTKSTVIASGKTNAEGQVDLQFRASGPGDLKLYAFKQAKDPASGEVVTQDATVEITSTTADRTWTSLGGRTFREKDGGGYRRTSGVGGASASSTAIASSNYSFKYIFDISQAMTALSLAQVQATALGLGVSQQAEVARMYARMLGIDPGNEAAAQLLGQSKLEPALGVGSAGKICESNGGPEMQSRLMPGVSGPELKVGGAVLAKFDCGRSLLTSPTGLAVLPKGWISGSNPLIANDGASLIANDGASLIANDGASLIANDGASLLANDGASLIANDGASLLPVSKLMSDHGAGIVSNHSGALIANDGASFNPLGDGTSLMPSTGR